MAILLSLYAMAMKIVTTPIALPLLREVATETFGDMIKAVVDIEQRVMALGVELHADAEAALLDAGSKQTNLWGINIYVDMPRKEWVEFDSLINIRPSQRNRSRSVENEEIRKQILAIVDHLIS